MKMSIDKNGSTTTLIVGIFVVLVLWQIIGSYMGIITPYGWLKDAVNEEQPAEAIFMDVALYNTHDGLFVTPGITPDDVDYGGMVDNTTVYNIGSLDEVEFREIIITTNAPAIALGTPYHLRITSEEHEVGTNNFWLNFDYDITSGSDTKTIRYRLEKDKCQLSGLFYEWTEFIIQLTTPNGEIESTSVFYIY